LGCLSIRQMGGRLASPPGRLVSLKRGKREKNTTVLERKKGIGGFAGHSAGGRKSNHREKKGGRFSSSGYASERMSFLGAYDGKDPEKATKEKKTKDKETWEHSESALLHHHNKNTLKERWEEKKPIRRRLQEGGPKGEGEALYFTRKKDTAIVRKQKKGGKVLTGVAKIQPNQVRRKYRQLEKGKKININLSI